VAFAELGGGADILGICLFEELALPWNARRERDNDDDDDDDDDNDDAPERRTESTKKTEFSDNHVMNEAFQIETASISCHQLQ
jgi:hypothetical protein